MSTRPKTIQIFLPDGNARSIRIAEITSRTVQAIQVPRSKMKEAGGRSELQKVGVYFLFGEEEDMALPVVYVGEAEDCYQRLKHHADRKDYWTTAVAVTSKTNAFTKAHAKYLEWYCHEKVRQSGRCSVKNASVPTRPFIPETVEADLMDSFETIQVLLSTLGYPVLQEAEITPALEATLYCRGAGSDARGHYVEDGMMVLDGSEIRIKTAPSAKRASRVRANLLRDGVLVERNGVYIFTKTHLFSSPSAAASIVLGRSANGWMEWKNDNGVSLDELERKKLDID